MIFIISVLIYVKFIASKQGPSTTHIYNLFPEYKTNNSHKYDETNRKFMSFPLFQAAFQPSWYRTTPSSGMSSCLLSHATNSIRNNPLFISRTVMEDELELRKQVVPKIKIKCPRILYPIYTITGVCRSASKIYWV